MLSVMTLNIWHDDANWSARRQAIQEGIARHDPDVIALQEVLKGPTFDQLQDLLEGLMPHWLFGPAKSDSRRPQLRKGVALAARWPLRKLRLQRLPDAGDSEKRVALHASCDSPHGTLELTSTHLNWRLDHGFIRCQQVQALADSIQSRSGASYPPIVAGDFNAEPLSDEIRFMTGLHVLDGHSTHFRDAWRMTRGSADGYTWSNENDHARRALEPERRLDYIFVAPPIKGRGHVLDCKLVCKQKVDGVWPSDHFGVYAELAT